MGQSLIIFKEKPWRCARNFIEHTDPITPIPPSSFSPQPPETNRYDRLPLDSAAIPK